MLLRCHNLKKSFRVKGKREIVTAVDGINFFLQKGENLGIVGESGCGKTTLARLVIKLLPAESGRIIFDQTDITDFSAGQMRPLRKNIQMVFQDPFGSLDPRFTIRGILREAFWAIPISNREKDERSREILQSVGLPKYILERYPHEFSGGERQRIAIARALVMQPKLVIFDEAVSALDVLVQNQILCLLESLQRKFQLTYFFISHNLKVVRRISKKIAVMYQGKIVEWAQSEELFQNPLHAYTKKLLTASVDYRFEKSYDKFNDNPEQEFVEKQPGHFVLE